MKKPSQIKVGQRFGRLKVLKIFTAQKSGRTRRWCICRCNCGNMSTVVDDSLRYGDSKSCGCLQREITSQLARKRRPKPPSSNIKLGQRFGRLKVLKILRARNPNRQTRIRCSCLCDCGNKTTARADHLREGRSKSCGCLNAEVASQRNRQRNLKRTAQLIKRGQRFGRWKVVKILLVQRSNGHIYTACDCLCDCGNRRTVAATSLLVGQSQSCRCLSGELGGKWLRQMSLKHGLSKTYYYKTWKGAIYRCTDPNNAAWKHYGGRGITVCERWKKSFMNFYRDMLKRHGPRPPGKSLDRWDNNEGYTPKNCWWATPREQNLNRRNLPLPPRHAQSDP